MLPDLLLRSHNSSVLAAGCDFAHTTTSSTKGRPCRVAAPSASPSLSLSPLRPP